MSISGDFGEEPELSWDAQMDVDELESETLVTGDGAALEEGDQVLTRLLIAGGVRQAHGATPPSARTPRRTRSPSAGT